MKYLTKGMNSLHLIFYFQIQFGEWYREGRDICCLLQRGAGGKHLGRLCWPQGPCQVEEGHDAMLLFHHKVPLSSSYSPPGWQVNSHLYVVIGTLKGCSTLLIIKYLILVNSCINFLAVYFFRGFLDYSEKVCKYWPDFAANGKDDITLETLVTNRVNIFIL